MDSIRGTLDVKLIAAKGLKKAGILPGGVDAYAFLRCGTQEKKSKVASKKGSEWVWDEQMLFSIADGVQELQVKVMDKDHFSKDDFLGEITVPLSTLRNGSVPEAWYDLKKGDKCHGEVKLFLNFFPEANPHGHHHHC